METADIFGCPAFSFSKPKTNERNIMAVKLIANYAKRLGLPGYSSHQFSVSVETELHDVTDIAGESARLYESLQHAVDDQIQQTGFVPPDGYGMEAKPATASNGGNSGNGGDNWECSDKQRELIQKIVRENNLDKNEVEGIANELFGHGVKSLNRLAASGLIDELLERYGGQRRNGQRNRGGYNRNGNGKGVAR
jgi:hypothetical protein